MAQNEDGGGEESFGSRFLSGLKGMILEDEVPAKRAPAEAPAAAAPAPAAGAAARGNPGQSPSAPAPSFTAPASQDSPMFASLLSVTLARATAYTALTEAMTPLEEIIPDEMTRYRAAFAVIKKNRTLEQVVQAIDLQHMEVLAEEVARFAVQAKSKQFQDVQSRVDESTNLKARIDAANAQVANLRRELEEKVRAIEDGVQRDRQRAAEIDRAVDENQKAIAAVQRQFDAAAAAVRESLTGAKAKILKYLA
ncbi:hypothetical protein [Massilia glaciei]|nr:hypothetical protein [Massilia glaciei]